MVFQEINFYIIQEIILWLNKKKNKKKNIANSCLMPKKKILFQIQTLREGFLIEWKIAIITLFIYKFIYWPMVCFHLYNQNDT